MRLVILLLWTVGFASVTWAAARFFRTAGPRTPRTMFVACAALTSAAVQLAELTLASTSSSWQWAALVTIAAAQGLFWWTIRAARIHRLTAIFEADAPATLAQTGPYRFIRHPFYAAYTLLWGGGAIASRSAAAAAAALLMFGVYLWAIREEERKFAASPLAGSYAAYRRRAGMLLPRLRRS